MNDSTLETAEVRRPEQIITPDSLRIIAGEGSKVINEKGWAEFRKQLDGLEWEPIANTQIKQIKDLREKAKTESPYKFIYSDSILNKQEVRKFAEEIRQRYPKDSSLPYWASSKKETTDAGKKLSIYGRERPDFGIEKATRIYMAISEDKLRQGFEILREELAANGALEKMILVLNLEVLDNKSPVITVDNNAIIMYVPDSNPDTLTKVAGAIAKAKEKQPLAFKLNSAQLANVKLASTSEFMIPLDDTTWFVEIEKETENRSYHTVTFPAIRKGIFGYAESPIIDGLPNMTRYKHRLEAHKPEIRSSVRIFELESNKPLPRRLAMPGLIVDVKPLPLVSTANTPSV